MRKRPSGDMASITTFSGSLGEQKIAYTLKWLSLKRGGTPKGAWCRVAGRFSVMAVGKLESSSERTFDPTGSPPATPVTPVVVLTLIPQSILASVRAG